MITGIGSLPFAEVDEAIDLIFSTCPEVPFWPQLPKRSPLENMYSTFLEGVPSIAWNAEDNSVFFDTNNLADIERFYENVEAAHVDAFGISKNVAPGLHRFITRLSEINDSVRYVKCQMTGPFSMGLGLKDENGSSIIYNNAFYDILKKSIHMKARWMISRIEHACPGKEIIIFFDEPYMVSFGSAYVSVSKEEVIAALDEVTHGLNAKKGVHVCANTDWSVLFDSSIDIVNYDAYNFLDTLFYYSDNLSQFLARGGQIAPGIVPSVQESLANSDRDSLAVSAKNFKDKLSTFSAGSAANKETMLTTSCGLGSLSDDEARRAMALLKELDESSR